MSEKALEGKSILVAEDEEINYLFLKTLLSSVKVNVIHAWNGQEAVDIVNSDEKIDLILMDIKMPILDGYSATKKIKTLNPNIPIIAQTAYTLGDDRTKCLNAGCDDYITKPIMKNDLFKLILKFIS